MLLTDRARKVLSVMWHTYGHTHADYVAGLPIIRQRIRLEEQQILEAFEELVSQGYLDREDGLTRVIWPSQLQREQREWRK